MSPARGVAGLPRAARRAVAVLFFLNGAAFANWVPRIPAVADRLELTPALLGIALLGAGLGGLPASVAAGPLVARFGSRRVVTVAGLLLCAAVPLPGLAPTAPALLGALVLLGAADAVMDVSMNAHGVLVQHRYPRSILNGFHAVWSLGAVAGAAAGSAAAAAGVSPGRHLIAAGLVLAAGVVAASRRLLPTRDDRVAAEAPVLVRPTRAVFLLGLLTLLAAIVEGVPADWSAVYLTRELDAAPGVAGAAFAVFSLAMLAGRLAGDAVVTRFGFVRTTRVGALLVAAGLGTGLVLDSTAAVIAGFGLAGVGICTVFPVAFGAAAAVPGLPPGAGISIVSTVARLGFLLEPALVGVLAEIGGLDRALLIAPVAALGIAALAGNVAPRRL